MIKSEIFPDASPRWGTRYENHYVEHLQKEIVFLRNELLSKNKIIDFFFTQTQVMRDEDKKPSQDDQIKNSNDLQWPSGNNPLTIGFCDFLGQPL